MKNKIELADEKISDLARKKKRTKKGEREKRNERCEERERQKRTAHSFEIT
jgi:hypothetical protein